ncbi:MAG: FAD-dependent oxidoreductase, partial [Firmicutes bacterium]|nr:FAD-dependent oxidoreductase [Bacillota bacterium]
MTYDIIVIGAGTAGMTAALYALRAGKSVMLLESENFGGQISYTPRIENYPGIKQVSGSEFSSALFDQVTALGAKFDLARVDKVSASSSLDDSGDNCNSYGKNDDNNSKIDDNNNKNRYKTVFAEGKTYRAKAVIIAVGVKPRRLNLPREDELSGEGVCYCAVCDGAFYMGTNVVVAGGGNTALTDALFLSAYCNRVHLVCLDPAFTAEKVLIDRVLARDNIKIMLSHTVTKLLGGGC